MAKKKHWQKVQARAGQADSPETDVTQAQVQEPAEASPPKPTAGPGSTQGPPVNRMPDSAPGKTITTKDGTKTVD